MKLFYTFAFLALASVAKADFREEMMALSKTCQEEVKATDEELMNFFKNGMKPEEATDAVKCHMKCMMEKRGHFKNGEFDDKAFMEGIEKVPAMKEHQAELAKVAADCKKEKGANPCDTAYKISMCFKENRSALGIGRE